MGLLNKKKKKEEVKKQDKTPFEKSVDKVLSDKKKAPKPKISSDARNRDQRVEKEVTEQVNTTNTGEKPFVPNVTGYSYGSAPDTEYPHKLPSNHPKEETEE